MKSEDLSLPKRELLCLSFLPRPDARSEPVVADCTAQVVWQHSSRRPCQHHSSALLRHSRSSTLVWMVRRLHRCTMAVHLSSVLCLGAEFVQLLTEQANAASTSEGKKTISESHVNRGMQQLEFNQLMSNAGTDAPAQAVPTHPPARPIAQEVHQLHGLRASRRSHVSQPSKKKKQKLKPAACNLSQEELLRMQKELFAGSRQKLETEVQAEAPS